MQPLEWVNDFAFGLVNAKKIFGEKNDQIQIHQGWYSIYMSEDGRSPFNKANARDQVCRSPFSDDFTLLIFCQNFLREFFQKGIARAWEIVGEV